MAFKLQVHDKRRIGMVAICDICGKQVFDGEGLISWEVVEDYTVGNLVDFKVLCKGECDQRERAGRHTRWQDIGESILYLLNNTRVNLKETARRAAAMLQFYP